MKTLFGSVLIFALVGLSESSVGQAKLEVTPVQKVIQLLTGMLEKGKAAKHEEQVQFAAYKQFCDDTTVEKHRSIEEAVSTIDMLQANIKKNVADSVQLGKEITEHDSDISVWSGDQKAASKVRDIEKADYSVKHNDYSESVDALQRAIVVLKKHARDQKQSAALAQVSALKFMPLIPSDAKKAIDTFLMQDPESQGIDVTAPEANAYEFQSHGIVEMLEKLLDKFIDERTASEKEEMNSRHAYEMLMQDLTAQIEQAKEDRGNKVGLKAATLQSKADAQGDLTDTTTTRDADTKYVNDLTATCEQKASDFESRQQLRTEEVQAIEKAINIISSDAVSENAQKHLPGLLQAQHSSFAQLRSSAYNPLQQQVAQFLQQQGQRLNSRVLSSLAGRVADDPFEKVKKLIQDLILRLMEEANEEAEHKGWCDTELSTNEQTRKEKTEAVETLHAEIDELEASTAKLTENIADLTVAVAELATAMAAATKLRQEEKKTNEATITDSEEAQTAVAQALVVLKEFYARAAETTALVQQEPPAIFDSPYKGMGDESKGVIGMLEVIQSDFARLQTETEGSEQTAQMEYDKIMTDSKVDTASKQKDIEHKTQKKQDEAQALVTKQSDLEGTQKELDAALAYFDKLKPSCVDAGVSYSDRVTRRKEEIESLQEALRILNGEDIAR